MAKRCLSEFNACFEQFLQFWVVLENPDYSASVDYDFVGAFEILEYAVESLILDLFG